jgi:hypothetical protein
MQTLTLSVKINSNLTKRDLFHFWTKSEASCCIFYCHSLETKSNLNKLQPCLMVVYLFITSFVLFMVS